MLSSSFHDGKLMSITVADEKLSLEVYSDGKLTQIQVVGLEKLRATEFKEGNIINSLTILSPDSLPDISEVRALMKYAYELNDADLERNPKFSSFLEGKLKEYQDGSLLVLEVEPSYGAYLVAIGRGILEAD